MALIFSTKRNLNFPVVARSLYVQCIISTLLIQHIIGCADIVHRMGELEPWIDENFVRSVWFNLGEQVNVKMIRDKFSG